MWGRERTHATYWWRLRYAAGYAVRTLYGRKKPKRVCRLSERDKTHLTRAPCLQKPAIPLDLPALNYRRHNHASSSIIDRTSAYR